MITESTIYEAQCDNCEELYIDDGSIVFYDRDKLIKDLKSDGWQITYKGFNGSETEIENIYCPECHDHNQ